MGDTMDGTVEKWKVESEPRPQSGLSRIILVAAIAPFLLATLFSWIGLAATIGVALFVTRLAGNTLSVVGVKDESIPDSSHRTAQTHNREKGEVDPDDEHKRDLVSNVHPPDWVNPDPAEGYNVVAIGAGTAGLVTAAGAAGLGAKVALGEWHLMGGD